MSDSLINSTQAEPRSFQFTVKEELAALAERLRAHEKTVTKEQAKVRLEIASDLVRHAICYL